MTTGAVSKRVDLRGFACPLTFVKTKLALEEMRSDDLIEIVLDDPSALRSIPKAAEEQGLTIVAVDRQAAGEWIMRIRKGGE